jgi:rod shape-determining protein MreC
MASKRIKVSKRTLFIWCLLGGFICLFAPPSLTNRLQLAYTHVFSWPLQAGRNLSIATAVPVLNAVDEAAAGSSQAELDRMTNRIADLEALLKEEHTRNDQLARLRTLPLSDRMAFLLADIITVPDPSQGVLVINQGKQDGVVVGQYVLGDLGVIGVVSGVGRQTAQVTLITNSDSKISVTLGQSDMARVMEGVKIPFVPTTYGVRKGDAVYAKKKPGLLDAPIIVGRIAQCKPDLKNPDLWDITVKPACEIGALTSVAVVAAAPQQ